MIGWEFKCDDSGTIDVGEKDGGDGGIPCLFQSDNNIIMGFKFSGRSPDAKLLNMVACHFKLVYGHCI